MNKLYIWALGAPLLAAISSGCGGGGGVEDVANDPDAAHVTLTATRPVIKPGESVTLTWTSRNASEVLASNLGTENVNGTVTVSPTITSDYTISVGGRGEDTATVRVVVDRPRPRFALVGNPADPEVPQIQGILQPVGAVTVSSNLPSPSTYDAVVIHTSGAVGPGDRAAVQTALAQNKGVVLVGFAPSKLTTGRDSFTNDGSGTDEVLDTSAIAFWFGGVTEMRRESFFEYFVTPVALSFFAAPPIVARKGYKTQFGQGDDSRLPLIESGRVGSTSYRTLMSNLYAGGFAFRPPTGGRVAWQWHSGGFSEERQPAVSELFRTTCLWAGCP